MLLNPSQVAFRAIEIKENSQDTRHITAEKLYVTRLHNKLRLHFYIRTAIPLKARIVYKNRTYHFLQWEYSSSSNDKWDAQ